MGCVFSFLLVDFENALLTPIADFANPGHSLVSLLCSRCYGASSLVSFALKSVDFTLKNGLKIGAVHTLFFFFFSFFFPFDCL